MDKWLASMRDFQPGNLLSQIREFHPSSLLTSIREFQLPESMMEPIREFRPTTSQIALATAVGVSSLFLLYRRYQNSTYLPSAGKVVFITGCDTGFGKAAALEFHRRGYVVFAGCLDAKTAKETTFAEQLADKSFHVIALDVTNQAQIDSAVRTVEEWLLSNPDYRLWCLVNNAGIPSFGPAEFVSISSFQRVMECNFFGLVRVSKAFLPLMRAAKPAGGRLVFMGSIGGHLPAPANSAYGCSKAAGLFLADSLYMEIDRFNIRVSVIMPDFYRTGIMEPNESLARLNREIKQTSEAVVKQYGGEPFCDRLRNFLTVASPPRAKTDLSPVINAVIDAAASKKPRRRYYPMEVSTKIATILYDFAPSVYLSLMKHFL